MKIRFVVNGKPQPQGSIRAFVPKGWSRPVLTTDNAKLKPWRKTIAADALVAMRGAGFQTLARDAAVSVSLDFFFARPKSARKRVFPTVKPDIDKIERACLDALTGVCFEDDAQVVDVRKRKRYGEPERVEIEIADIEDEITDGSCHSSDRAQPLPGLQGRNGTQTRLSGPQGARSGN